MAFLNTLRRPCTNERAVNLTCRWAATRSGPSSEIGSVIYVARKRSLHTRDTQSASEEGASRSMHNPKRSETIGFIGLGAMGNHMLNNLITKSMKTTNGTGPSFALFDVNQKAMSEVVQRHKTQNPSTSLLECSSPSEVAMNASTIITMVPTGAHVREVYLGENGIMAGLQSLDSEARSSTLCMDQSTIEQSVSKAVALKMREAGADMLDAPVSGGVVGAEKGTLAIMVGGAESSFERSLATLQPMAAKVTHCGDLGAGLAAKIANNMLLGITMLGLSEAMLLGKKLGVKCQVLADIINSSTGRCWSSEVNHPVSEVRVKDSSPPAHRGYAGGFVTKLAHKDLALAVEASKEADVSLILGKRVEEFYRPMARSTKWSNRDFSVVYEALQDSDIGKSAETASRL